MEVVISLGGSTLIKEGKVDVPFLSRFISVFKSNVERGAIVVGGGSVAREYAKATYEITGNYGFADEVAINITRANASLVAKALNAKLILSPSEVLNERYYVSGGFFPGITTDSCAVLVAEAMGIKKVVNVSNVDAIYTKDPREPGAKKIERMSIDELISMSEEGDKRKPGGHFIFDVVAAKLAKRSLKEIHFVGKNIDEIEKAIKGEKHKGTVCYI